MGDGRYYTFNQFFATVILTFLVIFLTASLALCYYRNKDKKSDRHLIFILLLVDVVAILKFIEELYMLVYVCQILRFVQIALLCFAVITFIDYLLTYFPSASYHAHKSVHYSVVITLMAVLITGVVWWSIVGSQFLFRHYDFQRVVYKAYYPAVWIMLFLITLLAVLRIYIMAKRKQEAGRIRLVMSMIVVLYLCPMLVYIIISSMVSIHLDTIEIMFVFLFGVTMGVILNSNVTYGITPFTFEKIRSVMDDYVFVVDANGKMVFKNDNAMNADIFVGFDDFDVYHPEDAFAMEDKETRKEHEAVYIRLTNDNNDIFFSYRYKSLLDKEQIIGYIITFVDITALMGLLNELEIQEQKTKETNQKLLAYKEVVYYLEKEKEINALLEEIINIQDKSMLQIIESIDDCALSIKEKSFSSRLDAVIGLTERNLNDVRKAVTAYREYYGGNQ